MRQELNGIIVVDKPAEMTSAQIVARLKKSLVVKKAGHTGTLDPFATGVMICCINRATRLAGFFLDGDKTYDATVRLGIETDTQDLTGRIVSVSKRVAFSAKQIRSVLKNFEGYVAQIPPVFSALKHRGRPLYKLARAGRPVQKTARRIFISQIELLEIDLPNIRLQVSCSAGTYIRTLCSDIGRQLGCGGHLTALRRTASCGYTIEEAATLAEIEALAASGQSNALLIPLANALRDMPKITVGRLLAKRILSGYVFLPAEFSAQSQFDGGGLIQVVDHDGHLIAVMDIDNDRNRVSYRCVFN